MSLFFGFQTPYGQGWQEARQAHMDLLRQALKHEQEMLDWAKEHRAKADAGTASHIHAEMECHAHRGGVEALNRLISVYEANNRFTDDEMPAAS